MSEQKEPAAGGEQDRLMGHEYDGIQEFDNPMPAWWTWSYVASIVFAIGYALWLPGGVGKALGMGGLTVHEEYEAEVAEANEKMAALALTQVKEEDLQVLLADASAVAAGKAKFATTCAVCHGDKGEGKIGPNLTDDSWIHGQGKLLDVYKTVSDGVPAKGMPTWNRQLKVDEIKQIVAFLGTIQNSNVPGKEAQGIRIGPPATPAATAPAK
jgi:cytochrome c oxidase cbb3-type subunit 3